MKRLIALGLAIALGVSSFAYAQNPVVTQPSIRTNSSAASTTITVTGTFQKVFDANLNRFGCVIQNKGTNAMYIYIGALADATTAKSGIIAAGNAAYCNAFGTVLTGQVNITGTSGDAFYASQY